MNTIIAKIRAEVERRKVDYLNRSYTFVPKAMQDLLDFLSDLEKEEKPTNPTIQEQPVKDFPTTDEEMKDFLATHKPVQVPDKYKTADWMFEKSEKPSEGLEEEVDAYMDEHFDYNAEFNSIRLKGNFFPSPSTLLDIARHFAQWGAEHLKK